MTGRSEGFEELFLPDMQRRLAAMVRVGTIAELKEDGAFVRVKSGNITTGWIKWTAGRAGPDRTWSAPEVGEQVIMCAPSGDLTQAVVMGSIYQDNHDQPANSKDITKTEFSDGATVTYNRSSHVYDVHIPAAGTINLQVGNTRIEIKSDGVKMYTPRFEAIQI